MELKTLNANQTRAAGKRLGALLSPGDLVLLSGTLGTGKTTFTQGVAMGLGVNNHVPSPTFVLVHRHQGRCALFHIDLYRVETSGEVEELAVDEMLEEGVVVIEWSERARGMFGDDRLEIVLASGPAFQDRTLTFQATNERWTAVLNQLATPRAR